MDDLAPDLIVGMSVCSFVLFFCFDERMFKIKKNCNTLNAFFYVFFFNSVHTFCFCFERTETDRGKGQMLLVHCTLYSGK